MAESIFSPGLFFLLRVFLWIETLVTPKGVLEVAPLPCVECVLY
jgi:hypothetical protein